MEPVQLQISKKDGKSVKKKKKNAKGFFTLKLPFRIRMSDKLYKIVEA